MRMKMLPALVILLSVIVFCAMVEEGTGQYIDVDEYEISLTLEKEGKYYGVQGSIEHKQDSKKKADVFVGFNLKEIATGEPVDARTSLDLVAGALTFTGILELLDLFGDETADASLRLEYVLSDWGTVAGTALVSSRWINGEMVGAETIIQLTGSGWSAGVSQNWLTQETKLFAGVSIPLNSYVQNISGHTVYGDPMAPRFNCAISGNLTTPRQLLAFGTATSLTSSFNETDPSGVVSEGTSQRQGGVGGIVLPTDAFVLLAPSIGLTTTALAAVAATAFYTKRFKHRKGKR